MAPHHPLNLRESPSRHPDWDGSWKNDLSIEGFVVESWSQGFMVGGLVIMAGLTIANMRRRLLLHKLILIELILAMFHGTFCFMAFPGYGFYVSSTAVCLYLSWYLHNIISWMKIRPFLKREHSFIFLFTFLCTTPYWIVETYGNFTFNNNVGRLFLRTRPFEALCRDPWWIFTACNLLYNIKSKYNYRLISLIRTSPRFGVMLLSMFFSIVFLIVDVLSAAKLLGETVGINPYWKLSLVFKCLCDTIILDDFRSALEKIRAHYFDHINSHYRHKNNSSPDEKNAQAVSPGIEIRRHVTSRGGGDHDEHHDCSRDHESDRKDARRAAPPPLQSTFATRSDTLRSWPPITNGSGIDACSQNFITTTTASSSGGSPARLKFPTKTFSRNASDDNRCCDGYASKSSAASHHKSQKNHYQHQHHRATKSKSSLRFGSWFHPITPRDSRRIDDDDDDEYDDERGMTKDSDPTREDDDEPPHYYDKQDHNRIYVSTTMTLDHSSRARDPVYDGNKSFSGEEGGSRLQDDGDRKIYPYQDRDRDRDRDASRGVCDLESWDSMNSLDVEKGEIEDMVRRGIAVGQRRFEMQRKGKVKKAGERRR